MSFRLPTADHPAREMLGDLAHVVELLAPENFGKLPDTMMARRMAAETLAAAPMARRVTFIIRRCCDERWLVSFGRRGGMRREWNFGRGY